MAGTLPTQVTCCTPCDDPQVVQVPGPTGADGAAGPSGDAGENAFTTLSIQFIMPADDGISSAPAFVVSSNWMALNQVVFIAKLDGTVFGWFRVVAIDNSTDISLLNLADAGTGAYAENSIPGSIFPVGSKVCPGGLQGVEGPEATGPAGGQLKGNYPDPDLAIPNTLGTIIVGNGTDAVELPKGTDGHIFVSDAALPLDVGYKALLPITDAANFNIADNRIGRLDGGTGLPIPIQGSYMTLTDNGALQTFFRVGMNNADAKGTDAVDLQPAHTAVTQVASGANSVLVGGTSNTASGANSIVVGGAINVASGVSAAVLGGSSNQALAVGSVVGCGTQNVINSAAVRAVIVGGAQNGVGAAAQRAFIGGGEDNNADGEESVVGGGNNNTASGEQSTVAGGDTNTASGTESFVGGGDSNTASGTESVIGGGNGNEASGAQSTIGGGILNDATNTGTTVAGGGSNNASGSGSTIGGGLLNNTSGIFSTVAGGTEANATHYGELAHASGKFASNGDAQTMELILRRSTTNATPAELSLDGSSTPLRATVPTGTSWIFKMLLVARTTAGLDAIYESVGAIRNNAGVTSANAITTTEIFDGAALPPAPVTVAADAGNNALIITVTGIAATTIAWVAWLRIVQVQA